MFVELVTQTRRTQRGIRTTEKQVPFHSSKQAKPCKESASKTTLVSQSGEPSRQQSDLSKEVQPIPTMEEHLDEQGDLGIDHDKDYDIEEPMPAIKCMSYITYSLKLSIITHICADTNGAMVSPTQQIPLHPFGDGGSYQGNQVFHV